MASKKGEWRGSADDEVWCPACGKYWGSHTSSTKRTCLANACAEIDRLRSAMTSEVAKQSLGKGEGK